MLKHACAIVALIIEASVCRSQVNLVPNPSFDNFITCPVGFSQFNGFVANWVNPNTATPDYMNACANPNPAGVPKNGVGWQQTHSGSGYAGGYMFSGTLFREFIQVQLLSPLVAGALYDFHMYVVLHNRSQHAVDDLGAYFSLNAPTATGTGMLSGSPMPQVANPFGNVITDTLNWTWVGGSYVASGGERWLTIGHLKPDALTTYVTLPYGNLGAYYYFDDVYLAASSMQPVELVSFTATPHPGGVRLNWSTASEENNAGFELQRSSSPGSFDVIHWIPGQGTSFTEHHYTFDDANAEVGSTYYYRLRQVDLDGRSTFSNVVVASATGDSFHAFASPDGRLVIELPHPGTLRLDVCDVRGIVQRMEELHVDAGERSFDLHTLLHDDATGLHLLRLDLDGEELCVRVVH